MMFAANIPIFIYNGDTLELTEEFIRKQCGDVKTSELLPEISGISCSRETPGFMWMQSDDYRNVVASDYRGQKCYMKISFSNLPDRWDWEDMCGGIYNGTNYLFVGVFGDNDEDEGNYYIIFFEEPKITNNGTTEKKTIKASYIHYQYPEGKNHNAEAIMYDNISQTLYVITKVYYDVCRVYSLPMSLDYGTEMQTLTEVCALGVKSDLGEGSRPSHGFHLVTGADISPDGSRILIKNHNNTLTSMTTTLIWDREGEEDISETLKRQPKQVKAYELEWQGEAICWLDNYTFYTTSDSEGNPPIYKYISKNATGVEDVIIKEQTISKRQLIMHNGQLCIRNKEQLYTLSGQQLIVK